MPYYARVTTKTGEVCHLAEVGTRHRPFEVEKLKTLCGYPANFSMEGSGDPVDCLVCLKMEENHPLPRRSEEDTSVKYVPSHRRPKTRLQRVLKDK